MTAVRALVMLVVVGCGGDDGGRDGAGGDGSVGDGGGAGCAPPCARAAFNMVGPEGNDVFLVDLSGVEPAAPVRVTTESVMSAQLTGPRLVWAPSALALAFDADGGIFYVDLSGPVPGVPRAIVPEGFGAGWRFAWTADSRWIVFESEDAEGRRPTWAVDVSGGSPAEAIELGERGLLSGPFGQVPAHPSVSGVFLYGVTWVDLSGETPTMVQVDLPDDGPEVSWSPTGEHLAVYDGTLGVVAFDGTDFGPLRELGSVPSIYNDRYRWSPDGTRIAYRTDGRPRIADLSEDPLDTFPVGNMNTRGIVGWLDDDRIALDGGLDVLTVEVQQSSAGTPESATMGLGANDWALSRDGGALAFLTIVGEEDGVPHVVELDGESAPRHLAETGSTHAEFSPSSTRVLFGLYEDSMTAWMITERSGDGPAVSTGIVIPTSRGIYVWSPDDDRVLWRKDVLDRVGELYYTDLRGETPGPAIRIAPAGDDRNVGEFAWAPAR